MKWKSIETLFSLLLALPETSTPEVTILETTESSVTLIITPGPGYTDVFNVSYVSTDSELEDCIDSDSFTLHVAPGVEVNHTVEDLRLGVTYDFVINAWAGPVISQTSHDFELEITTGKTTLWICGQFLYTRLVYYSLVQTHRPDITNVGKVKWEMLTDVDPRWKIWPLPFCLQ